jgi:hypothetical protein
MNGGLGGAAELQNYQDPLKTVIDFTLGSSQWQNADRKEIFPNLLGASIATLSDACDCSPIGFLPPRQVAQCSVQIQI